jgi:hypothetical protein
MPDAPAEGATCPDVAPAPPDLEAYFAAPPFGLPRERKGAMLLDSLTALTRRHHALCQPYANMLDGVFGGLKPAYGRIEDLPFLPVNIFKKLELMSVPRGEVIKTLTSSGTTGQVPSRIFLDRRTAQLQQAALVRIVQHFTGRDRLPMIVADNDAVIKDRTAFSARGAGIVGMMQFGRSPVYALDGDMNLRLGELREYAANHAGGRVLVFGFTFMVWQHLIRELERQGATLGLEDFILIHSGGWKKLEAEKVGPEEFSRRAGAVLGRGRCVNFYGMVEQVGGVFFESTGGGFRCSSFSEVIVRDPVTLEPLPPGVPGRLQVLSFLPSSYPGHSILTEDMGVVESLDDGEECGTRFRVLGRLPASELRGCSDTYTGGPKS